MASTKKEERKAWRVPSFWGGRLPEEVTVERPVTSAPDARWHIKGASRAIDSFGRFGHTLFATRLEALDHLIAAQTEQVAAYEEALAKRKAKLDALLTERAREAQHEEEEGPR